MGDTDHVAHEVLIALGSNLGDRAKTLALACDRLADTSHIEDLRFSSWHSTAPIGGPSQGEFLNGAAYFRTTLSLSGIFSVLQTTEQELGRTTVERWGPRVIDLDLLLYADKVIELTETNLVVPHPRMAFRSFVLHPASEVAPQMRHPVIGWTIIELWRHLQTCPPITMIALGDHSRSERLARGLIRESEIWRVPSPAFTEFAMPRGIAAEFLWSSQGEPTPPESSNRPKLVVCDSDTKADVSGPTIDISGISDELAAIEIAAAMDAMRE